MPSQRFYALCPDVAMAETRTVGLPKAEGPLPAGWYLFKEMFKQVFSRDSEYVERVKRHDAMFHELIESPTPIRRKANKRRRTHGYD